MAEPWRKIIEGGYGPSGVHIVETALKYGPDFEASGVDIVLPSMTLDLISTLALALDDPDEPAPQPDPPTDIMDILPWNPNPKWPFPTESRSLSDIYFLTVHHSGATLRDQTSIEAWNAYHTKTKGWSHIGYHFGIASLKRPDQGGVIDLYQFNRIDQVTWHDTYNYNSLGLVIACDCRQGRDGGPNDRQVDLWGEFTAWMLPKLPNLLGIVPHNYFQQTACPGYWEGWKRRLVDSSATWGVDISDLVYNPPTRTSLRKMAATIGAFAQGQRELFLSQGDV